MHSSGPEKDANVDDILSSRSGEELDRTVDSLLRDGDFLLAQEIKHRIDELNRLFVQASGQQLRVELETSVRRSAPETPVTHVDVTVLKEI